MTKDPPIYDRMTPGVGVVRSTTFWDGFVRRHLAAPAPLDLAEVEAAIDRMPVRWIDRLVFLALVNATLFFWVGVVWWIAA